MNHERHIRARMAGYNRWVYLDYFERTHEGRLAVARSINMETVNEGDSILDPEPTFRLTKDMAQELMDDLWQCGMRPSEGSGSAGSLAATERHLHDLRALVFSNRGMEPKK